MPSVSFQAKRYWNAKSVFKLLDDQVLQLQLLQEKKQTVSTTKTVNLDQREDVEDSEAVVLDVDEATE